MGTAEWFHYTGKEQYASEVFTLQLLQRPCSSPSAHPPTTQVHSSGKSLRPCQAIGLNKVLAE